jgi:prevent-host-death family protein
MNKKPSRVVIPKRKRARNGASPANEWQLQDAKARFSEVFRLAHERGPQRVTRHGQVAVVVLREEEYARLVKSSSRQGTLAEFFARSPLAGSGIDLDRQRDFGKDLEL